MSTVAGIKYKQGLSFSSGGVRCLNLEGRHRRDGTTLAYVLCPNEILVSGDST